jgi:DNA-directed RNA polymerase II subunit RPB1
VADSLEFKINLDLNNSLSKMQQIVSSFGSVQSNNIYKMVSSKSKGSETNLVQIMCCLGNQNVNGKRCPLGFEGRALPHFPQEDHSPEPRGFVFSSFFKGLKPHEFYFHSMAGREGLSDTAVKTSSIGYLQRKLVKALEDISIHYDGSVRDSNRTVLQFCYGEDGFLPEFVERHTFNDVKMSLEHFVSEYGWTPELLQAMGCSLEGARVLNEEIERLIEARNKMRARISQAYVNPSVEYFCPINIRRLVGGLPPQKADTHIVCPPWTAVQMVDELVRECTLPQYKQSKVPQIHNSGMEIFHLHLRIKLCSKKVCFKYKLSEEHLARLCKLIKLKYKQALAPSGEPVGPLAAQSIGEPTTQMTLNTFHLAGVSDKNVTLGIPRLRELLDVSSNMKTPCMTVFYRRPLDWAQRNSREMVEIQNQLLALLPERNMKDCLSSTRIYFDAGDFESHVDSIPFLETEMSSRTPWVLSLRFDSEKIISLYSWQQIRAALMKNMGKDFIIRETVEFGSDKEPEILMRLKAGTTSKIKERNAYRFIKQKEIEVKHLFVAGQRGVKSLKTFRHSTYHYPPEGEMNMALDNKHDNLIFTSVGSNLRGCLGLPLVDPRKCISNDLFEVNAVLGIEAARQLLLNEIKEVLKPYSIYINHRHLAVLADWMTVRGKLTPVNRFGINRARDISTLRKATFEETMHVLYEAAAFSGVDDLNGVSERLIFGEKVKVGTNSCEVLIDRDQLGKWEYQPLHKKEDLNITPAALDLSTHIPGPDFANEEATNYMSSPLR